MMRLKLFENFDLENIKSVIDDVLVELKDNGFNIRKIVTEMGSYSVISVYIIKTGDEFEFNDIEECVIMLVDYINSYLPDYKDIKFFAFDNDLHKLIETDSIDIINSSLAWCEAENKEYKLRTFKVTFGSTNINKIIAENYIDDIQSDDSITGLDITLSSPRIGVRYFSPIKYRKIIQRQKDKYKYLTESLNIKKIESDLSDMFIELFDIGYDVLIGSHNDTITLSIRRDDKQKFNTADVREYILMAEDYFKNINKDIKIIYDGIGTTGRVPKNRLIKSIQMIVWN